MMEHKDINRALMELQRGGRARDIALRSSDPLEALAVISPESAAVAYADNHGMLSPQILPIMARYRELESHDRTTLVGAMLEKYRIDKQSDDIRYQVDGAVDMTRMREDGATQRTGMHEEGETNRAGIHEYGATQRTRYSEQGATMRESIQQNGLTERVRLETQALTQYHEIRYQQNVALLQQWSHTQEHISDNELAAVRAQTEAYKYAIVERERIKGEVARGVSRDQLEGHIKTALIGYAQQIQLAEIARAGQEHETRAAVISTYLAHQTQLYIEAIKVEVAQIETHKEVTLQAVKSQGALLKNREKTKRRSIGLVEQAILSGKTDVEFTIFDGDSPLRFVYKASDDQQNTTLDRRA